jgi:hypothetical protein
LAPVVLGSALCANSVRGGALSGTFAVIPAGTAINLSTNGPVDWVHWGTYTEYASDRKAGVPPWIGNWTSVGTDAKGTVYIYQFAGNPNGYTWFDGVPATTISYTDTGVWAYKDVNINKPQDTVGSGFTFSVPADTVLRRLKVYVGAYNARGRFVASLSDGSAPSYSSTALANTGNGPSAVYTVTFAANSAGQNLTVTYTVAAALGSDVPNVTLQAAALAYATTNNPPVIWLNQPANNATFAAGLDITIEANALDTDSAGSVTNVEFFAGANKLGAVSASPYTFVWSNVPPGNFILTARATDNNGDSQGSDALPVFVYGNGGTLVGTRLATPGSVTLSLATNVDWAHWGLLTSNSFDHRASVIPQISNFTRVGTNAVERMADDSIFWSWTGGTPTASAANSTTAVYLLGYTNGFELTLPADTNARTLRAYVGVSAARGTFQATLSDFSAPAFTDESLANLYNRSRGLYVLSYSAASANQFLKIRYTSRAEYDEAFGSVSLHSAMLTGNSAPYISVVPDQLTATELPLPPVPFNVSDGESLASNLVVAVVSSNTNLIANSDLVVSGAGSNRLLTITWAANQIGTSVVTLTVMDEAGATVSTAFLVTILPTNIAPVLLPVADQILDEQTMLSITNSASDANDPPQLLTFSIVSGPTNARIDPITGDFSWLPTEAQGPSTNTITLAVKDNGFPILTATQSFVVVVNEVNLAPSLAPLSDRLAHKGYPLTFVAAASDPDLPMQSLGFLLSSGTPAGPTINPTNGVFTWTPGTDLPPSTNLITVVVTDNGPPPLSDAKSFTLIVLETNRAPQLTPLADVTVVEEQRMTLTNYVADVDWPVQNLTFRLDTNAPAGASINPTNGVLTWTPTEYQGPGTNVITVIVTDDGWPPLSTAQSVTVTVLESNRPPALAPVPELMVNRGNLLLYTNFATDPDWPPQPLVFLLNANAPAGAAVNPTNGILSWRPTMDQGPATNVLTVTVGDGGSPPLSESRVFSVIVLETNRPPVLLPIPDVTIYEGGLLTFTNYASDIDWPAQTLSYSFGGSVPVGATLNPANGVFAWTPSEDQGPGTNLITVAVSDSGQPPLTATQTFTVIVLESNRPPVLAPVPNFMVMKGHALPYPISATDPDWPVQALVFTLGTNAPVGATVGPTNGLFEWTPAMDQGPSTNTITVIATDSGSPPLTDSKNFTVIVLETNRPPVLEPIGDRTLSEGQLVTVNAHATDVDWPTQTLSFSLGTNAPAGSAINSTNGVFTWTPSEQQGPGTNLIALMVTDDGSPPLSSTLTFTVTVLESNRPPVLAPITNVTVVEEQLLVVSNAATDPDWPPQMLTFSLQTNAPAGASINPTNGLLTWTPTEYQGPGTNVITVIVTDDGPPHLSAAQSFTVTVLESNRPPVLAPIADVSVYEGQLLVVTNFASDPDWPAQTLTFSLDTNAPAGASIDSTNGSLTWIPTEFQGPGTNRITVILSDGGSPPLSSPQSFTVIVLESNRPPVLQAISDVTVIEGQPLVVTNFANDPDWPAQTLTFSLHTNAPAGAFINPTNGLFSWTPPEVPGSGTNLISVIVVDSGLPQLSATQSFTVTVLESNRPPVLVPVENVTIYETVPLVITNLATDPDWPAQVLTFSLDTNAPAGAFINATNGILTWTPSEQQGPGTNVLTITVTDNGFPALSDSRNLTVTVLETNQAPLLPPIVDMTVFEGQLLTVTNYASDEDWPVQTLTFSLDTNAPAGAMINPTNGVFTWTPSEFQGPGTNLITIMVTDNGSPALSSVQSFTVKVLESNLPPVLEPIADFTIVEGELLLVTAHASDPDWPAQTLSFSLGTSVPGASINSKNGLFMWSPAEDQGPGTNLITIMVADNGSPPLSSVQSFTVTVLESNRPPALNPIPDFTVIAGDLLVVTNEATDPDWPAQALRFSLGSNAPNGCDINATNGIFTWTPAQDQAGTNTITVLVTDTGSPPPFTTSQSFHVTVLRSNYPPVLAPVAEKLLHAQTTLIFTNAATDPDPGQLLTFSFGTNAPEGALLGAESGVFTWRPEDAQVGSSTFTVRVTDNGLPNLTSEVPVQVTVVPRPQQTVSVSNNVVTVSWTSVAGQSYRVQKTDDLSDGSWTSLVPDVQADASSAAILDAASEQSRFYRVLVLP